METAIFAAGCFWDVESRFARLPGVVETEAGYAGGHAGNPTYKEVCAGDTGHAEAVRVTFDPERISYARLVEEFFNMHDPTQKNRQGPDIGAQYRSAIFAGTPEQATVAERMKMELASKFERPIVTNIETAGTFWRAEEYHQKYAARHGGGC